MNEPTMGVGLLGDSSVRGTAGTIADVVFRPVKGEKRHDEIQIDWSTTSFTNGRDAGGGNAITVITIATVTFTESRTGRLAQPTAVTTSLPGMATTWAQQVLGQKRVNSLFRRMR
jgi:hypothetical protein